jgi:hypothetical protein
MTSSSLSEYSRDVRRQNSRSLAIEKHLKPETVQPSGPPVEEKVQKLNIAVIFTSLEATLAALKEASTLASSLGARITLLVPQVVPYPLPLDSSPVLIDFNEKRFRLMASESPVETSVQIYLCRDRFETLAGVLTPGSLVVLGGRKRWWPTHEKRLANRLRRASHEVVFKETE